MSFHKYIFLSCFHLPWNFPYIWSALVNLSEWMYVCEVTWWMKERKKDIFVERHIWHYNVLSWFSWGLHTRWCRHPNAGYIHRQHAIIFAVYDPTIIRTIKYMIKAILCKNGIWDQFFFSFFLFLLFFLSFFPKRERSIKAKRDTERPTSIAIAKLS